MNLHEELMERLARRRSASLGGLSDAAYAELLLAVREQPEAYVDDPRDDAFNQIVKAVDRVMRSRTSATTWPKRVACCADSLRRIRTPPRH